MADIVAKLQERVAERRRSGFYPEGLEQEMDEHFRRIPTRPENVDIDELRRRLRSLEKTAALQRTRVGTRSRVPGGGLFHKLVARATARQMEASRREIRAFADDVRGLLTMIVETLEGQGPHGHVSLFSQIDLILDRLAALERSPANPGVALAEITRRLDVLEQNEARRGFHPWYRTERFEDEFRGAPAEIRDRYRDLAARFDGLSPVLDIGCGRGIFLELLAERGIDATGVDTDEESVKAAVARGLRVEQGDGIAHLARMDDASLGGLVAIQVVEHMSPQDLLDLVALAAEKVRPGGSAIFETVNPTSLMVFASAFYVDPTHLRPIHPAYLEFLFREAGFEEVSIEWRSPVPDDQRLATSSESAGDEKANLLRLDSLLFGPQDYAVVALR